MRALDWRRVLTDEHVPFIERGANVKRGEINIRCPFCGSADPSYHMGLNLDTGWWSCWRHRKAHSGKSPIRLLMRLLGVPYWKAREIAGLNPDFVDPEGFTAVAARLLGRAERAQEAPEGVDRYLDYPKEFAPLLGVSARRHRDYLLARGFEFVEDFADLYDLQHAKHGDWRDRVIIPYRIDGELVTWTGRAIAQATIRYRDLSVDESLVPPKETLFNYDCIARGGRALVIVEGPVDALKIDYYGREVKVRAVGLSTNSISDEQAYMLEEARGQFDRLYVMADQGTALGFVDSMRLRQELAFLGNIKPLKVPFGLKDAGAMSADQAISWTNDLSTQP